MTSDAFHMTAPDPSGAAGGRAIRAALASAGIDADRVDYVNAHGTATPQNDSAETAALKSALGERARRIPVSSIKSMIGHCLCASGAIEAVATVMTVREGTIPPTIHYENPDPACDLDYVPNGRAKRTFGSRSRTPSPSAATAPWWSLGVFEARTRSRRAARRCPRAA